MKRFIFLASFFCLALLKVNAQEQYTPTKDAMLRGGSYSEENYGALEEMYVKASPSSDEYSRKIIMQFDVSSTSYSSIKSAVLKLYCTYLYADFPVSVFITDDNWDENTVTWANAPSRGDEITTVNLNSSMVGRYVEFDITPWLISKFKSNKIISVIFDDKSLSNNHARFYSKETAQYKPVLTLEYGVAATPAPPSGLDVINTSGTKVTLKWTDNSTDESGFRIYRRDGNSSYEEVVTVPADSTTFTDNGLEANTTYYYQVAAYNAIGESDKSAEVSATTTDYISTDYYVDNQQGNDSNDGLTPQTAWKTLEKLNNFIFEPGDKILFKTGQVWVGELHPKGSGVEGNPIVIDEYGDGEMPLLQGPGTNLSNTLSFYNQQYWEINNLKITNPEPNDATEYNKRAIYVEAEDTGQVNHFYFRNLEITDVAVPEYTDDNSKYYGGIYLEITGALKPTWFNDILFEGCYIHHLDRTGISNQSSWSKRGLNSKFGDQINDPGTAATYDNWVPSTNMVLRNCRFERIGGNGIIMRVSKNTLVEDNFFTYCGEDISGNAAFCFDTDSTVFQYNEACYTVYNDGDTDAAGIDSDYHTKHTIIQYNYLHHNGFAGVVATGGPGGSTTFPRFNDSTLIRYNIMADNDRHIVRGSGKLSNMFVYNNVVFSDASLSNIEVIAFGAWSGAWPEYSYFQNNIFYVSGSNPSFAFGSASQTFFSNNCYSGNNLYTQNYDTDKVIGSPDFETVAVPEDISKADYYKLQPNSVCIDKGLDIAGAPKVDFFGNKITSPPDIGIYEFGNPTSVFDIGNLSGKPGVRVFPNVSHNIVNVELDGFANNDVMVTIVDEKGNVLFKKEKAIGNDHENFVLQLESLHIKNGLYFLNIVQGKNTRISKKIIKI